MKIITATAAALFLFAATGIASAQDSTSTGNTQGGNAAAEGGGNSNCTDYKPGTNFSQMSPKCREDMDKWVMGQSGSVAYEGELAEGAVLPDTVTIIDVPRYDDYGYVMLNDRRMLVNRKDRTVVHVYN